MEPVAVERFWHFCAQAGVTSKRLSIHTSSASPCFPLSIILDEPAAYGAPLVSVPYLSTLNVETLRGDVVPRAMPPYRKVHAFLTRRGRMDDMTAQSLWIAAFVSSYARLSSRSRTRRSPPLLAPLLSPSLFPPLPSPFLPQHAAVSPAVGAHPPDVLQRWERRTEEEVRLMRYVVAYHARRRGVPAALVPSDDELLLAHRTVMQRSVVLPAGGEPSAPAELAELLEAAAGDVALLPSLVPVIDLIRPIGATSIVEEPVEGKETANDEPSQGGNCALFTCVHSDFISAATRRRAIVETAPLAARRVVVCATRALKAGEELRIACQ